MSTILQAHMPGNYESYDSSSREPPRALCKSCWEEHRTQTTDSLLSVWVTVDGFSMVWWLCRSHAEALRKRPRGVVFVKSADGTTVSPEF